MVPRSAQLSPSLTLLPDTCNVYVIRDGDRSILVDIGSGDAIDQAPVLGFPPPDTVLVTHHHRDQVQGLPRAVERGIAAWVPPVERDLIANVDQHW